MASRSAVEKRHLAMVGQLACVLCGGESVIHHVKLTPGQPRDDALVIPLCPAHHNEGAEAIHRDVLAWERAHGSQIAHMLNLYSQLPIETEIACRVFGRLEEIAHRLVV